ncbi:MAG: hypothetical protein KME13_26140 [Myxacorys californica WJT36-NPBG1]|jgi:hypothetical protein|nr:hypothetical protein [Myxacorys californica WJT36-NPBG1]
MPYRHDKPNSRLSHASDADDRVKNRATTKSITNFGVKCSDGVLHLEARVPVAKAKDAIMRVTKKLLLGAVPLLFPALVTLAPLIEAPVPHDSAPPQIPHQVDPKG